MQNPKCAPLSAPAPRRGAARKELLALLVIALGALLVGAWMTRAPEGPQPRSVISTQQEAKRGPETTGADELELPPTGLATASSTQQEPRAELGAPDPELATLDLLVVDLHGPVESARVHMGPLLLPATDPKADPIAGALETDAEGRLRIQVVPRKRDTIRVSRGPSQWGQQLSWQSPGAGESETLKIRLSAGPASSKLVVTSYPTGEFVTGARITIGTTSSFLNSVADRAIVTDAAGAASIPITLSPDRDPYTVTVLAEGHAEFSYEQAANEPPLRRIELLANARVHGVLARPSDPPPAASGRTRMVSANGILRTPTTVLLIPQSATGFPRAARSPKKSSSAKQPSTFFRAPSRPSPSPGSYAGVTFDRSQVIVERPAQAGGKWSLDSISFTNRNERRTGLALLEIREGHARVLAKDITLTPGQVLEITDPTQQTGPQVRLQFVYTDGRPLSFAASVELKRDVDGIPLSFRVRLDSSGLSEPFQLEPGEWDWSIQIATTIEAAKGTLLFERQSEAAETIEVKLRGLTSITGRVQEEGPSIPRLLVWRIESADPDMSRPRLAATERGGEFTLSAIPVGSTVKLTFREGAVDLEGQVAALNSPSAVTIDLPPGSELPWTGVVLR